MPPKTPDPFARTPYGCFTLAGIGGGGLRSECRWSGSLGREDLADELPPLALGFGSLAHRIGGVVRGRPAAGPGQCRRRVPLEQRDGELPHGQIAVQQEFGQLRRLRRGDLSRLLFAAHPLGHACARVLAQFHSHEADKVRQPRIAGTNRKQ